MPAYTAWPPSSSTSGSGPYIGTSGTSSSMWPPDFGGGGEGGGLELTPVALAAVTTPSDSTDSGTQFFLGALTAAVTRRFLEPETKGIGSNSTQTMLAEGTGSISTLAMTMEALTKQTMGGSTSSPTGAEDATSDYNSYSNISQTVGSVLTNTVSAVLTTGSTAADSMSEVQTTITSTTTSSVFLPNKNATETDGDAGIGGILQVLLDGASSSSSDIPRIPSSGDDVITEVVTTDMQYSILSNLTNLTIDFLSNGTYRGLVLPGDGGSSPPPLSITRYSIHEGVLIGLILSLIVFFSIFGNIVVCAAILSDRNLRKTSNYFIISLAVADMLVAAMVMSFAVANDILGYWIFGETFCSVWISLDIMCSTASIVNLCAISLDRYVHIRSPLHYDTWVTPSRTLISILAVWVMSALISFVPIHLGWHQLGITPGPSAPSPPPPPPPPPSSPSPPVVAGAHYICMMELNPWYAMVSSMVSFYMPCVVMIAIYLRLYAFARRHVVAMKTQTRTPMLQNGTSPPKNKQSTYYKMADHKAAITLGVIMGTFLFCWTPFFTINIVGAFCPVCIPTVVFQVFTWLGYFNSTLNPIIYSIFNKEFRDAFKRVLSFRCSRCCRRRGGAGDDDFWRPIKYTETYGTVNRKAVSVHDDNALGNEITAV